MKYLSFVSLIVFLVSCGEADQQANTNTETSSTAVNISANDSTTIQWIDPAVQDLGKMQEGQVAEISWRFKNTGDKPLVFSEVRAGCGCTVADKPEEPIAPGQEGVIKAKFDSKGQPYSQHKSIYVRANNRNKTNEMEDILAFKVEVEKQ